MLRTSRSSRNGAGFLPAPIRAIIVLLCVSLVSACSSSGSGDEDDGNNNNPPPPPANRAPTASPGGNLSAETGQMVTLDGAASSDPDGDTLAYAWEILSGPANGATLTNANAASAQFQASISGTYVVRLTVSDPDNASGTATLDIVVTDPVQAAASRVLIDQPSVFLPGVGQKTTLVAQLFDAQGNPVNAAVTWTSTAPDQVSVSADGELEALQIGSALIHAEADGVRSSPTLVAVAEPAPGAVLVADSQVVSIGAVLNVPPDGVPGVGTQYEIVLKDLASAPAPGTVILATGQAPIAGKVVSATAQGDTYVIVLELAPLYEVLARYHLDWEIDLSEFALEGVPIANPKPAWPPRKRGLFPGLQDDGPLRPFQAFDCDGEAKASLAKSEISLSPSVNLKLIVANHRDDPTLPPDYVKHALSGSETLTGSVGIKFKPNITATGTCLAQARINIPVGGWISVLVMPAVRLGLGVELSGTLVVAEGEISATGKVGSTQTLGWECGGTTLQCRGLKDLERINEFKFKANAPNLNQMHVEASGHFFVLVGLDLVFFLGEHAQIVEARLGPKQAADLMIEDDQAKNEGFASTYDLKLEGSIKPGSALAHAIRKLIDDDAVGVNLSATFDQELSKSPRGTLEASADKVRPGEHVDFTVRLDGDSLNYAVVGYNVQRIELWRKGEQEFEFTPLHSIPVSASNQSTFQYRWEPEAGAVGKYKFAAFVSGNVPVIPMQEIAENSIEEVDVSCFGAHSGKPGARGKGVQPQAELTCADRWIGTSDHLIEHGESLHADITWEMDPALSDGNIVVYAATGTFEWHHLIFEEGGCTVSPTHFTIEAPGGTSSNMLNVDYNFDPPKYAGSGIQATTLTISCPDDDPFDVPASISWFGGLGELSEDWLTMSGQTSGPGTSASWHFTRP